MYVMVPKTGQKCMDYMHWDGDEELRNTVPVSKVCSSSAFALATWFWWSPEADDLCVFQLKTRGVLGLSMEN